MNRRARILTVALATLSFSWVTACTNALETEGSSKTDQSSLSSAAQDCDSSPTWADDCLKVNTGDALTWQETVSEGDPEWRTITSTDDGTPVVEIDSIALNAGVIPTADGQGQYASETDFEEAMQDLLGVSLNQKILYRQSGTTAKLSADRQSLSGNSTGDFFFDALSDENGEIYIDGQKVAGADNYPDRTSLPVDDQTNSSMQTTTQGVTKFSDTNTSAKINAHRYNLFAGAWAGSTTKKFKRNGKGTRLKFYLAGGFFPWVKRIRVLADSFTTASYIYDSSVQDAELIDTEKNSSRVTARVKYLCIGCNAGDYIPNDSVCARGSYSDGSNQSATGYDRAGSDKCDGYPIPRKY
jgi:hypothetical protein